MTLDRSTHTYTELVDGFPVVVPSLHEIMKGGGVQTDFSMVDPSVLQRKADIGTAFHLCVELHLAGKLDEDSIDDAVRPYWVSFCKGVDQDIIPDLSGARVEEPVGGLSQGYATTPDIVKDYILDWKCSVRLYPTVWIQLAGQARALGMMDAQRMAVQLRPNQKPIVKTAKEPKVADTVFASAYNIYQWKKENGLAA